MITCVFVVHNVASRTEIVDMTYKCLDSFMQTIGSLDVEVFVIDNGSKDSGKIFELLLAYKQYERDKLKFNFRRYTDNAPIAQRWNEAIIESLGEIIVLVNNDVVFNKVGWLDKLILPIYNSSAIVGVTGSKLMSWNEFSFLEGAFIAFSRTVANEFSDSGKLFDEQFEFTGEEVDFCHRVELNGKKLIETGIESQGYVTHLHHGTLCWMNEDGGWQGRSILDVMHESRRRLCRKWNKPERIND